MSNGGYIGIRRVPSASSAPGLWRDRDQYLAKRDGIWPPPAYRYFRVNITALNGDGYTEAERISFVESGVGYPNVNMTADNLPSPLVASANSVLSGYEAFYAFSTDIDAGGFSRWHSNNPAPPIWLQIDLGANTAILPTSLEYTPRFGGGVVNRAPSEFQVLASNTGAFSGEQVTIYSATGLTTGWANNTLRTFTF